MSSAFPSHNRARLRRLVAAGGAILALAAAPLAAGAGASPPGSPPAAGTSGSETAAAAKSRKRCRTARVKKRSRSGKVVKRNGRTVFVKRRKCRKVKTRSTPRTEPAPGPTPGSPEPAGPCQAPGWRSDLCAEVSAAMASGVFFDMADAVTFALLYQHYRTGQAIAPSIAASVIEPLRSAWDPVRGRSGLSTYRVSDFLDFWVYGTYAGVEWPRFPDGLDTPQEFLDWWQTYGIVQFTARQNAINHRLNGIVESEVAWRNAMEEWKAYDLRLITAQQYSDATVFAHRTLEDAQTAVLNAQNAIKGPR
jgi:hypothetical protein